MKDLVVTINSVQKSSKSDLSSGTFGHFKVCKEKYFTINFVKEGAGQTETKGHKKSFYESFLDHFWLYGAQNRSI